MLTLFLLVFGACAFIVGVGWLIGKFDSPAPVVESTRCEHGVSTHILCAECQVAA